MKYVHPDYKTKEVIDCIDDLILNGNVESISDITFLQKSHLSGMLLHSEPLTEILNFISQNDNDENFKQIMVLSLIDPKNNELKQALADRLKDFSVDYYEPMIESILNERLDEIAATE